MNKTELKAAWGKYCDTDKLVDSVIVLLTKYDHRNSEHGVCTMLNTYFENKRQLINILASSPDYIGDMRVAVDIELERTNNRNAISSFCRGFLNTMNARQFVVARTDEHGKTAIDYTTVGVKSFKAKDLFDNETVAKFIENANNRNRFNEYGEFIPSIDDYNSLNTLFCYGFANNSESTVNQDTIYYTGQLNKSINLVDTMKVSRAFNKVCTEYGIDKLNPTLKVDANGNIRTVYPYDKLFAEYSDMVSGAKRKLKFFISVNPLDYLTMSFGNSWKSCHSIKTPHGGWCGGTMSYMLDSSSIVTYVHTEIPTDIEEGKIYRNMFHYKNGAVLQSRIYPQENDGSVSLYNEFWKTFTKAFSPLIGVDENSWSAISGYECYVTSVGSHYRDYNYNSYYFRATSEIDGADGTVIPIGHTSICAYCGREDDTIYKNKLAHDMCKL